MGLQVTKSGLSPLFIIWLLGALSIVSPFSIDMNLPSFPQVAGEFGVPSALVALTLSSYFIGMALGQILYGPLLDRFGRKPPLCAGLAVYILASVGCALAQDLNTLIVMRFIQAIGGSAAGVASMAMVRDFFPAKDAAKIFSRMFLFIAVSPLLAPSAGSFILLEMNWRAIFIILAVVALAILALVWFVMPEGHKPDKGISLKPWPVITEYWGIMKNPVFATYSLAGGFAFAGLFTYVAGAPILFMDGFHLTAPQFSGVFILIAVGFIGGSQINVLLLKKYSSEALFAWFLVLQAAIGVIFLIGTTLQWFDLTLTLAMLFVLLGCVGISNPNSGALAIMPFTRNVGSASALRGFLQLGIGAVISSVIGAVPSKSSLPIVGALAATAVLGLIALLIGQRYMGKGSGAVGGN